MSSPEPAAGDAGPPRVPTDRAVGLSAAEAGHRLARFGANAIADRRTDGWLWSQAPGRWMACASIGDVRRMPLFALQGWLMAALAATPMAGLRLTCVAFAVLLDLAKRIVFPRSAIV